MNYKTSNGVKYDYECSVDGAHFFLLKENHTKEELEFAKKELKRERDVVSIRLVNKEY